MKYFVEIGSNNYDTLFSLCESGWTGVMVEPLKSVFDELPTHKNLHLENVAIAETEGERDLYVVESATDWSSLLYDHHKKIDHNSQSQTITVQSITFDQLMERCKFPQIDFLKIDAEGYDATIIKTIDLNKYAIQRVQFEHRHMSVFTWNELLSKFNLEGFELMGLDESNANFEKV